MHRSRYKEFQKVGGDFRKYQNVKVQAQDV